VGLHKSLNIMNKSNSSTDFMTYFEVMAALNLVTFAITLPAILFAIYVVYQQIRLNQAVHVYVLNILISDILQCVGRLDDLFELHNYSVLIWTMYFAIILNVSFMMCIAVERYLMISHPLWYSIHCTVKRSILTSLGVWMVSLIVTALECIGVHLLDMLMFNYVIPILLLLPFPLLLFLFVGTWRGLSKALTLSTREKRRILATLGLVIGSYTFFFLPFIIVILNWDSVPGYLVVSAQLLLCMNPLSDLLLYIFVRKDRTRHILQDISCCHRSQTDHEETDQTAVTSL
uniref:G-protein coupled receptors family 1 profile domain-containing protein n=1 Tax=Scleropages formosus TaxID=113540 RepID=A0A8C9RZW1_SCLFO